MKIFFFKNRFIFSSIVLESWVLAKETAKSDQSRQSNLFSFLAIIYKYLQRFFTENENSVIFKQSIID